MNTIFIQDDKYKEIIKTTIITAVDLIFLNSKKQILLGLRNNEPLKGVYYIIGGRRLKNEGINESLIRKATEELSIRITPRRLILLGVYDDMFPNSMFKGINSHYYTTTYVYMLNKKEEKNIKNNKQHENLKFFDINDKKIHKMVKIRIADIKKKKILK